jgi:hypothetical protein
MAEVFNHMNRPAIAVERKGDQIPAPQSASRGSRVSRRAPKNPYQQHPRHFSTLMPIAASVTALGGLNNVISSGAAAAGAAESVRRLRIHINFDGGSRGNPGIAGGAYWFRRRRCVPIAPGRF